MKKLLLVSVLCLFSVVLAAHPIKMTTGKLSIDTGGNRFSLTLNFFIDDFESELRKMVPQSPFNYTSPDERMTATITDYVKKYVQLYADNEKLSLDFTSVAKIQDNVCQVIFTGVLLRDVEIKQVTIINTLLFSSFDKQSNILHVYLNDSLKDVLQFYPSDARKVVSVR